VEDLAAQGREQDTSIVPREPSARPVSLAEALRPADAPPGWTSLPELADRPLLQPGQWNDLGGVA
jgi:hypothetical protein